MRLDQQHARIEGAARVMSEKVILHGEEDWHRACYKVARDMLEAADAAVPVEAVEPTIGPLSDEVVPVPPISTMSEEQWTRVIADHAHAAVLRMRPHEKLIVERHEPQMAKPLFTLTFQSPTGGAYG